MKTKLISAACALLLTSCSVDYHSQTEYRQTVLEQMNATEICAVPGSFGVFIVRVHGQIWFVETGLDLNWKPTIRAKTLIFNETTR